MTDCGFTRLPRTLLEIQRDQPLFEAVRDRVAAQVEDQSFVANSERLAAIPIEAQTIYWLWRFQAEAGWGGLEVFVLEPLGIHSPQVHAALKSVGAQELALRLEAAIAIARTQHSNCAEFTRLEDRTWFGQFPPNPEYPTLQSVDRGIHPLIDALTDAVVDYIKANSCVLFEPEAGS